MHLDVDGIDGVGMAVLVGAQISFVGGLPSAGIRCVHGFVALGVAKSEAALKELGRALSRIMRLRVLPTHKVSVTGSETLHGPWSKSRI